MMMEAIKNDEFIHPYTFAILKDEDQKEINGNYVNELIKRFNAQNKKTRLELLKAIQRFVEDKFNLDEGVLISKKRDRKINYPRQIFCYCLRKYYKATCIEIGDYLKRDHSTITHHYHTVEGFMIYDKQVINDVNLIRGFMNNEFDYIINYKNESLH